MAVEPIVSLVVIQYHRPAWTLTGLLIGWTGAMEPQGADRRSVTAVIGLHHWMGVPAGRALADPGSPAGRSLALAMGYLRRQAREVQLIIRPAKASQVGAVHHLTPDALLRTLAELARTPEGVLVEVAG